uniref:Uncharacterized protein n=1 Tax=Candidatus Kentrum sp. FW TaxID=2126338 RepID=A0A450SEN6_9GAMM|nr:MAG: hypothetical protein BECKFW1821B_GA0114236_100838 [Candidatus Kentron sp. FW]
MNNLEQELHGAFSRLEKKISQARTLHIRYEMMEEHRLFLIRQSIFIYICRLGGFSERFFTVVPQGTESIGYLLR